MRGEEKEGISVDLMHGEVACGLISYLLNRIPRIFKLENWLGNAANNVIFVPRSRCLCFQ